MPETTEKPEAEQKAQPKAEKAKGGTALRLPMILGAVLLAQVAISYALISQVLFRIDSSAPPEEEEATVVDAKEEMGSVFLIPELVVNPSGSKGGAPRYIKCGFGIEVDTEAGYAELETRQPQVLDTLIRILTSKTLEEIDTPQEKDLVRLEIKEQLNDHLIAGEVTHVFLTDFVIQ